MTRTRTRLVCLFATVAGLNACAATNTDLDAVNDDLADALAAGNHELALQIGADFLGRDTIEGEGSPIGTSVEGYVTGFYFPVDPESAGNGSPVDVRGRLITSDTTTRYRLDGSWLEPTGDQIRGELYALTIDDDTGNEGGIGADFRDSPMGAEGALRGTWNAPDAEIAAYVNGHWADDDVSMGRFFGAFGSVLPPEWGVGVRVRIEVSGVSTLTIAPQGLTIHHYEGIAPGQAGVGMSEEAREARPTIINGQHWAPEWPEDGQNVDCDCTSSTFHAPDGVLGPQVESMIDLSILRGRGLVKTVMGPTADNDYTTVIQIDDSAYNGPAWYEVELSYPEL